MTSEGCNPGEKGVKAAERKSVAAGGREEGREEQEVEEEEEVERRRRVSSSSGGGVGCRSVALGSCPRRAFRELDLHFTGKRRLHRTCSCGCRAAPRAAAEEEEESAEGYIEIVQLCFFFRERENK